MQKILYYTALGCGITLLAGASALAGPIYLPPGSNLTFVVEMQTKTVDAGIGRQNNVII